MTDEARENLKIRPNANANEKSLHEREQGINADKSTSASSKVRWDCDRSLHMQRDSPIQRKTDGHPIHTQPLTQPAGMQGVEHPQRGYCQREWINLPKQIIACLPGGCCYR